MKPSRTAPLAAAIGHEVVTMLAEGEFQRRAAHLN